MPFPNLTKDEMDLLLTVLGLALTVILPTVGGIYKIVTDTKKYELTEAYRRELLQWYGTVVETMTALLHLPQNTTLTREAHDREKIRLLAHLSAQIEVARFYFPNVIKKDGHGKEKPAAYQGYRRMELERMLDFYRIANAEDYARNLEALKEQEREFTSLVFEMVNPPKRNRKNRRKLEIKIPKGESREDDYVRKCAEWIREFQKESK